MLYSLSGKCPFPGTNGYEAEKVWHIKKVGLLRYIPSTKYVLTCWTFFVTLPFKEGADGVYEYKLSMAGEGIASSKSTRFLPEMLDVMTHSACVEQGFQNFFIQTIRRADIAHNNRFSLS